MVKLTNILYELYNIKNKFPETFEDIHSVFKEKDIIFCFIGGSILPIYKYNRFTEDIDVIIDSKNKKQFYELESIYFRPKFVGATKKFIWNKTNVLFDVIFSGEENSNYKFESPEKLLIMNNGLPILSLFNLIKLKLYSGYYGIGRKKDIGDIEQLIDLNNLSQNFMDALDNDKLVEIYKLLWNDINSDEYKINKLKF